MVTVMHVVEVDENLHDSVRTIPILLYISIHAAGIREVINDFAIAVVFERANIAGALDYRAFRQVLGDRPVFFGCRTVDADRRIAVPWEMDKQRQPGSKDREAESRRQYNTRVEISLVQGTYAKCAA